MIPQQTFESYPVFGDNATKVQPDNAKYSAGFIEGDVYPAEWVNWKWNKDSQGIADANRGLTSVEKEINSVLTGAGKTADESQNDQLLRSIQKLIDDAEIRAKLAAHPVGSLYWSSVNTDPATLFGGTWSRIKDKFILAAGDTYTNGNTGGAATVTLTTDNLPAHTHSVGAHKHGLNSHTHSFTPAGTVSSHNHSFTPAGTVSSHNHSFTPAGTVSKHKHSFTPAGTVSAHAHGLNSHTHTLNEHTHSVTAAGTITVKTNPTFTGSAVTSGAMSGNSTGNTGIGDRNGSGANLASGNCSWITIPGTSSAYGPSTQTDRTELSINVAHTHSVTAAGTISGGAYTFTGSSVTSGKASGNTGAASGNTANATPTFTGTAGNTEETTPTFTGTAGTTGNKQPTFTGTAGTTGDNQPTFTGTEGTTGAASGSTANSTAFNSGSTGSGTAVNKMPPYIVKYCWERVS